MVNATREVYKLVQRAYYSLEMGNYEIAKLFWDKAVASGVTESADGVFTGLDIIIEALSDSNNVAGYEDAVIVYVDKRNSEFLKEIMELCAKTDCQVKEIVDNYYIVTSKFDDGDTQKQLKKFKANI